MPKPLCHFVRSIRHVCCLCARIHIHTTKLYPFSIHFKFNSFSIFASFVLASFKENGKFIEFILTRNMFARRSHTFCYSLFLVQFRLLCEWTSCADAEHTDKARADTIKGKRSTNTRIIVIANSLSERKEVE